METSTLGITTTRGAYWLTSGLLVLGVTVAAFYGARTHDLLRAWFAAGWMVAVAIGAVRALRAIDTLNRPPDWADDRATAIALQLAALYPIVGIVPLILIMLP